MGGAWAERGWALVRGLLCWAGAVVLIAVGGLLPLILAAFPALALIGKSGVFNRILRRRTRVEAEREDAWPF